MATNDDNNFPASPGLGTGTTGGPSMGSSVPRDAGTGTGTGTTSDDMLNRVVQGAHHAIDRLAETAAPHVHRLSEGMQSSTGHVREVGEEWTESLRTTVRDHPLAAVATALAVGLLIARITR